MQGDGPGPPMPKIDPSIIGEKQLRLVSECAVARFLNFPVVVLLTGHSTIHKEGKAFDYMTNYALSPEQAKWMGESLIQAADKILDSVP